MNCLLCKKQIARCKDGVSGRYSYTMLESFSEPYLLLLEL